MRSVLIAACTLVVGSRAAGAVTPFQQLEKGRREFRANDFAAAILDLKDLVYPETRLAQLDDILEVHLLLGACEFELGNRNEAHDEFERALAIQLGTQLDTLLFSPGAVKLFNEAKAEVTARVNADRAQHEAEARLEATRQQIANLRYYEVHPLVLNFIPFGIGQYQNNQSTRFAFFSISEGLTFATSLGIWAYLVNEYSYNGRVPAANAADVRHAEQVEVGTGIAFLGLYVLGVVDSLRHYNHRTQIQAGDLPPSLREPPPPPPQTSLRDRLHFGPIVLQSGLGVGLSLED